MSFNSLMSLLVAGLLDAVGEKPSVIELGNQTLKADDDALRAILARTRSREGVDRDGLEALLGQAKAARGERAADLYRLLGFADYRAIDVNDRYGSLVMDLNKDLADAYGFRETFSLVTNNGTGEHVFDQAAIHRNAHALARPGGVILHVQPFVDYHNHGFYSIQPNLFHALAAANDYALLALGVATRDGDGVVAREDTERGAPLLADERVVPLEVLLAEAKTFARGPRGWLKRFAGKPAARRFGAELRRLQRRTPKLLVFAALQKRVEAPFRVPIQGIYRADVDDAALAREYGLNDEDAPGEPSAAGGDADAPAGVAP